MSSSPVYSGIERRSNSSFGYPGRERRGSAWSTSLVRDERTLVRQAMSHDRQAFALLYDRHVAKIYRYAYHVLGTETAAEQLSEQVFVRAWAIIESCPINQRPFADWLFLLARRAVTQHREGPSRAAAKRDSSPSRHGPEGARVALAPATASNLNALLDQLRPDEREVVVLRFVEKMSVSQVAALVGKAPEVVRTLQLRALGRLAGVI